MTAMTRLAFLLPSQCLPASEVTAFTTRAGDHVVALPPLISGRGVPRPKTCIAACIETCPPLHGRWVHGRWAFSWSIQQQTDLSKGRPDGQTCWLCVPILL
ncbi:hypothetical protein V8C86DRAFT_2518072 [Haematococcus lacustris]